MPQITRKTLIKDLRPAVMREFRVKLDPGDQWKKVAEYIKNFKGNDKFSNDDIKTLELELRKGKSPTDAMFRSWTYDNPTVQDLLKVLTQAEFEDLVRFMVVNKMQEMSSEEFDKVDWPRHFNLVDSEPAQHEVEFSMTCQAGDNYAENEDATTEHEPESGIAHFTYDYLLQITDDFNSALVEHGGRLLGSGGYADVFLGRSPQSAAVAVKRLKHKENAEKQFLKEVEILHEVKHSNIINLIGISKSGKYWCILSEFMENGTIEERLACKNDTVPLDTAQRSRICKGIAQGLDFLHGKGHVHRDIKSANILLDYDFSAKIADCGLVHLGPKGDKTHTMTSTIIGTTAYMAPEYFDNEISVKLDSFSFGIVILEILTALPPYDDKRENRNLGALVREHRRQYGDHTVTVFLDKNVLDWDKNKALQVFQMASRLTERDKYDRPKVSEVLDEIMNWPIHWSDSACNFLG